ncbi:MAG: hypothetical protein AB7S93_25090 [Xanthobacteraceae bacterium]
MVATNQFIFTHRPRSIGIRGHPTSHAHTGRMVTRLLDRLDPTEVPCSCRCVGGSTSASHVLVCCAGYDNAPRPHLSLCKDAPIKRAVQQHGQIQARDPFRLLAPTTCTTSMAGFDSRLGHWFYCDAELFNTNNLEYRALKVLIDDDMLASEYPSAEHDRSSFV